MSYTILPVFDTFPKEAALIGRMLAGYADLEIELMNCVQAIRDFDIDTVLKAMFRTRGETQRIQVADAIGRQRFEKLGIGTEFSMALGAMRHCLQIRNQYAHCVWHHEYETRSKRLAFMNLEELAGENAKIEDLSGLTLFHVTVDLLQKQLDYFAYTLFLIAWVNDEGQVLTGKLRNNPLAKPKQLAPPDLHIP